MISDEEWEKKFLVEGCTLDYLRKFEKKKFLTKKQKSQIRKGTQKMITYRNSKRIGRFAISLDTLSNEDKKIIEQIFSKVVIYEAHIDMMTQRVVYSATSELFSEVEEGKAAPWYYFMCTREVFNDGSVKFLVYPKITNEPMYEEVPLFYDGVVSVPKGYKLVKVEEEDEQSNK